MHVFVIHPGASFATHDVYVGAVEGLRACGATVSEGRLDSILAWYQAAIGRGVAAGRFLPDLMERAEVTNQGAEGGFNLSAFASAHITRAILAMPERPDWVLAVSGVAYNVHDVQILRRAGIRVALLCTETPYFAEWETAIGTHYDLVLTHERAALPAYRRAIGLPVHYLPHAYNPALHAPDGPALDPCDVRFVGSLFDERKALFGGVNWAGIDARIGGLDPDAPSPAGVVPNDRLAALYRGARIAVNHHRTSRQHGSGQHIGAGEAESLGPRAYEIAACGAFQIMDDSRPEAREVFGAALVTYRTGNSADLERKIRYYLRHDAERREIAQAQHAAVAVRHSWHKRGLDLLNLFDHYGAPRAALALEAA